MTSSVADSTLACYFNNLNQHIITIAKMTQFDQIGSGNDMGIIISYGSLAKNEQSSNIHGSGVAVHMILTDKINKNPETELKPDQDQT